MGWEGCHVCQLRRNPTGDLGRLPVWHLAIAKQVWVELRVRLSAETLGSVAKTRQHTRSLRKQLREGQRALLLRAFEGSQVSPAAASMCAFPSSFSLVHCGEFKPDVSLSSSSGALRSHPVWARVETRDFLLRLHARLSVFVPERQKRVHVRLKDVVGA